MKIELDSEAKALYLRLRTGRVADTAEVADGIVVDKDDQGRPLGIEFVRADEFGPFLRQHGDLVTLPARLQYESLDKAKTWGVETGADPVDGDGTRAADTIVLNGRFISAIMEDPSMLDAIPEGAVVGLEAGGHRILSSVR